MFKNTSANQVSQETDLNNVKSSTVGLAMLYVTAEVNVKCRSDKVVLVDKHSCAKKLQYKPTVSLSSKHKTHSVSKKSVASMFVRPPNKQYEVAFDHCKVKRVNENQLYVPVVKKVSRPYEDSNRMEFRQHYDNHLVYHMQRKNVKIKHNHHEWLQLNGLYSNLMVFRDQILKPNSRCAE